MGLQEWLFRVALGKGIKRGVQFLIAWLMAQGLEQYGVKIDETVLTGSLLAGTEVLRNFLKVKLGWKFL